MGFKELGLKPADVDHWVFPSTKSNVSQKNLEYYFKNYLKAIPSSYNFNLFKKNRIHYVDHQMSHVSLSVFGSNFEECIFLSTDGGGDMADQRGLVFVYIRIISSKFSINLLIK